MSSSFERRAFADQLSIETPEQVALEFPVAGIGSRFVALLLDHLIQLALFVIVAVALGIVMSIHPGLINLAGKWFIASISLLLFLVIWGYFSLLEAFWHGQTPGKRALKLRVIKDSGRQITLFEALARNLLRFVDSMPTLYLAGVITMLCNKRSKRLGDLAAGTIVIHERMEAQPLLWSGAAPRSVGLFAPAALSESNTEPWQRSGLANGPMFPADAVARLSSRDLTVIEAFFARALDLPLDTRAAMAHRVLGEMCAKMSVALPEGNPERTLEAIAAQLRGQGRRRD